MSLPKRKDVIGRRLTRRGSDDVRICVDVEGDLVVAALVDPESGKPRSGKRARMPLEDVEWLPDPSAEETPAKPDPPAVRQPGRTHLAVMGSVPRAVYDALIARAEAEGTTQSAMVRRAVEVFMGRGADIRCHDQATGPGAPTDLAQSATLAVAPEVDDKTAALDRVVGMAARRPKATVTLYVDQVDLILALVAVLGEDAAGGATADRSCACRAGVA